MNNKKILSPKWAILPLLFCSTAVLAGDGGYNEPYGQIPASEQSSLPLEDDATLPAPAPDTMRQAQSLGQESDGFLEDSTETSSVNTGYVGGNTRIGIGIDSELKGKLDATQVLHQSGSSATIGQGYVGVNPMADQDIDEEILTGAGAKLSHHWVSGDPNNPSRVNKVFGAYDQNINKDNKATVGYGQETSDLFWSGHVSKGLSGSRTTATPGVSEKAYDLGVGGRVGAYLPDQQMRVQGGLDYEWGKDFAASETRPAQTTLTGGVEKFFPDTPHSLGAEMEVYKKSGGAVLSEDAEMRGGVSYRYDIGSEAGVWQPEQRYRRIRTEIPGEQVQQPPKIERKLVKNTMELESDTFFKLDRAELTPEAKTRMQAVLGQLRASGHEGNIRITGNTCDKGSDAHNLKLSERRANAVRDFMIKNGFSGSELLAQGLGESQPKYPNTEAEGHKNRRVDIEYVTYQNEYKDEVIEQGGTSKTDPKVVWRKELIPEPPLWVRQALRNVIDHKQTVDTYTTKASSSTNGGATTSNVPVAVNDTATTTTGTPVSIDVLANDTDPNRDVLIISTFNQGVNGSVTKVGNSLVYTSVPGFTGTDTFSYVIVDPAGNKSTAMVTVTVGAPSPNAPVVRSDTVTTISGTPVRIAVLDNDSDPNGDTLSVAGFSTSSNGTVLQEGNVLVYTPRTGFVGTDTFTYTAIDPAGNRNNATVSITVTAATPNLPVANVDQVETLQNAPVTITVLGNDTDPNGDTLSLTAVGSAAHGTVTRSGNTVIYTPNAGFTGEDQFTYTVSDGNGNNATANVFVKINAPGGNLKAVSDLYTVDMNSSANIFNVTNNDEFPTTGVTVSIVGAPSHGSASISGNTVVYTPNANFSGVDKLTYRLTDSRGGTAETTVDITVSGTATSANLAPVDDYLLIDLNDTVTRSLPVLANDAGDGLTIVAVSTPRYGSASIASDGLSIRYTLRNGYCTDHSFTYIVKDKYGNQAQATVVIDVSPANVKDPNSPPG